MLFSERLEARRLIRGGRPKRSFPPIVFYALFGVLVAASYVIGLNYRKVSAKAQTSGVILTVLLASAAAYLIGSHRGDWLGLVVYVTSSLVGLVTVALVVDLYRVVRQSQMA